MKRLSLIFPVLLLAACSQAPQDGNVLQNGKYTALGLNFEEPVQATVTVRKHRIADIQITDGGKTYDQYKSAYKIVSDRIIEAQNTDVDGVTSATYSSNAVKEAVGRALAQARGEMPVAKEKDPVKFNPGTYTGQAKGYGGQVQVKVTFSEDSVTNVTVGQQRETAHVGDVAFSHMTDRIVKANGTGVDGVTGATFSSHAVKAAVNDAAVQAGVTNLNAFMQNRFEYPVPEPWEISRDVIIIGAGGAGLCAGAQAAQDGNTVLIIEKNYEMGGNTLVSGGIYQSVDHSLVWEADRPDATTAIGFDGKIHNKVRSTVGCVNDLKVILGWNEEPFDESYYKDHEFVAGDIVEQAKHGVHQDFLPTLKELKGEISAYLKYAEPKLAKGMPENQLIQFSTTNLHIFQTYYGGLRQSVDKNEWIHGDYELIRQFVEEGEQLKPWLMEMGVGFTDSQSTLVGALWYRGNTMTGWHGTFMGMEGSASGNWGSYVMAPYSTIMNANADNMVMLYTGAEELIFENGRVCGVKATRDDGTKVIAHANKGVIIATGGYAANIQKVLKTNKYWSRQYLSPTIGTTNRSSLRGDGIDMAQAVGAATVGMGYTQLLPLAYSVDGAIAFGGVESAVFISPATGKRYIDECSERDVLSLAAFRNGIDKDNSKGVFLYVTRGFGMGFAGMGAFGGDNPGKEWGRKGSQLGELFQEIGLETDAETVRQTIRNYDMAVMEGRDPEDAGKRHPIDLIGNVRRNADGSYDKDSYDLENANLRVRLMAPSTHHTMGGLKVDLDRHVLDENGKIIPGLYAAGEVTGGFFGGNRLGGNALTEVMASGRIAARSVQKDN